MSIPVASFSTNLPPGVRVAVRGDVPLMAELHLKAFPGFFLSALGIRFLRELYRGILNDPTGLAFVYAPGTQVLGLVAGTIHPEGFYGRLIRRRWFFFALASIGPVCRRPYIARRLLRALKKPSEESQRSSAALLMSLAVDPDARKAGAGTRLVQAYASACTAQGIPRVRLTTDQLHNDPVNRFYSRQGFRVTRTFATAEGRQMNEYVLDLAVAPPR